MFLGGLAGPHPILLTWSHLLRHLWILLVHVLVAFCPDKIPDTCNLKEERVLLAHGFSLRSAFFKAESSRWKKVAKESCLPDGSQDAEREGRSQEQEHTHPGWIQHAVIQSPLMDAGLWRDILDLNLNISCSNKASFLFFPVNLHPILIDW